MVYAVGIVPEDTEIVCRRLHGRQSVYHRVAVAYAAGIGMKRYAPHTLYQGILHQLL